MKKPLTVVGMGNDCTFCIEPMDGRKSDKTRPVFVVTSEGQMTWSVCGPHLAAVVKSLGGGQPEKPVEVKSAEAKLAEHKPVAAVPVNSPVTK